MDRAAPVASRSGVAVVPLVLPVAIVLGLGLCMWTAHRHPTSGIAGWLLLVAIGLVLSPIFSVIMVIVDWQALPNVPDTYVATVHANIGKNAVLGVFALYAANSFFRKKEDAPRLIIWLLLARVVLSILMMGYDEVFLKGVIFAGIGAFIWIPYLRTSSRVKATFGRAWSMGPLGDHIQPL